MTSRFSTVNQRHACRDERIGTLSAGYRVLSTGWLVTSGVTAVSVVRGGNNFQYFRSAGFSFRSDICLAHCSLQAVALCPLPRSEFVRQYSTIVRSRSVLRHFLFPALRHRISWSRDRQRHLAWFWYFCWLPVGNALIARLNYRLFHTAGNVTISISYQCTTTTTTTKKAFPQFAWRVALYLCAYVLVITSCAR